MIDKIKNMGNNAVKKKKTTEEVHITYFWLVSEEAALQDWWSSCPGYY
jgi:hypothetical protein